MQTTKAPKNIDEYISAFPPDVQKKLEEMRAIIKKAAPAAREVISYSMPAFSMNGIIVYFAAHTSHIGFYPTNSGVLNFSNELKDFRTSKGAIQFPLDRPIPADLVTRIVEFRLKEVLEKSALRKKK